MSAWIFMHVNMSTNVWINPTQNHTCIIMFNFIIVSYTTYICKTSNNYRQFLSHLFQNATTCSVHITLLIPVHCSKFSLLTLQTLHWLGANCLSKFESIVSQPNVQTNTDFAKNVAFIVNIHPCTWAECLFTAVANQLHYVWVFLWQYN